MIENDKINAYLQGIGVPSEHLEVLNSEEATPDNVAELVGKYKQDARNKHISLLKNDPIFMDPIRNDIHKEVEGKAYNLFDRWIEQAADGVIPKDEFEGKRTKERFELFQAKLKESGSKKNEPDPQLLEANRNLVAQVEALEAKSQEIENKWQQKFADFESRNITKGLLSQLQFAVGGPDYHLPSFEAHLKERGLKIVRKDGQEQLVDNEGHQVYNQARTEVVQVGDYMTGFFKSQGVLKESNGGGTTTTVTIPGGKTTTENPLAGKNLPPGLARKQNQ